MKTARRDGDQAALSGGGRLERENDLSSMQAMPWMGSYCCTNWNKDNPDKLSRRFVESFEKILREDRAFSTALTYDAFMLLADAIGGRIPLIRQRYGTPWHPPEGSRALPARSPSTTIATP